MIGDEVEITVLDIRGDKVRLGISAPTAVPVHRKEVYLSLKEENVRAAAADPAGLKDAARLFRERSSAAARGGRGSKE